MERAPETTRWRRFVTFVRVVGVGGLLAGCSGLAAPSVGLPGVGGMADVTGYSSANALITTGYSDNELAPDRYEVRAKGSAATPPARLETIALARAAAIGVELKMPYFKVSAAAHSIICKPARDVGHKGARVAAVAAPAVSFEAVYAKAAIEPSYQLSSETFDRLRQELADETVSAEGMAAAVSAIQARCGK